MVNRNLSFWLNFHDFNNLIFTHQLTQIIFKPTNLRPLVSKRLIILPTNFRCTASGLSKSSVRSVSSLVFGFDSSAIHKCLNYLGRWLIISDLILHIFVLETGRCGSDPTANPSWWWEIKDAFIGMTLLGILAAISHKIGTKFQWNSKITHIFGEINIFFRNGEWESGILPAHELTKMLIMTNTQILCNISQIFDTCSIYFEIVIVIELQKLAIDWVVRWN